MSGDYCKHKIKDENYFENYSCSTPYCVASEEYCLNCNKYVLTCKCGCMNNISSLSYSNEINPIDIEFLKSKLGWIGNGCTFDNWVDFGILWKWVNRKSWNKNFLKYAENWMAENTLHTDFIKFFINYEIFPKILIDYLREIGE